MNQSSSSHTSRQNRQGSNTNRVETLHSPYSDISQERPDSIAQGTVNGLKSVGTGMVDQLFNWEQSPRGPEQAVERKDTTVKHTPLRGEFFNIFSWREQEERREMQKLREMIEAIKQEVQIIRKENQAMMSDVKDIENLTLNTQLKKPTLYDISFFEIVLRMLKLIRSKMSESHTWMEALMSKKKKRGSVFAALSKKQGTQYSLSHELNPARAVQ